jgi:hypothetical protein
MADKIPEDIPTKEFQKDAIEPIYNNLVRLIKKGEFDGIIREVKDPDSKFKKDLEKAGVILAFSSTDSEKLERISRLGPFIETSKEDEVLKLLMEEWSLIPVDEQTNLLFAGYPADNDLDLLVANCGNEFILKLDETVCFIFCEELAHASQISGKEDRFISERMKETSMPKPGPAKVKATELDVFLYMIDKGLGPDIKQSTWLKMHQKIYGEGRTNSK